MLERTTAKMRRAAGTRFQRYAPLISLLLSTAAFVLTLAVVLPGTKKGRLENFHLITLNTSNIGVDAIQFTPITTQAAAVQHATNEKDNLSNATSPLCNSTANAWAPNTTSFWGCTNSTNSAIGASPSSTPAGNLSTTANSSQPVSSSTGDSLASIIQDITAAIEGDIGSLIEGIIQNITESIESGLTSGEDELGQFFAGSLKNATTGIENGNSTGTGLSSFIQGLISGSGSSLLSSLTGSGSGSGLKEFFSNLVGNFTANVDKGLSKAEGSVAEGITNALGIQEFYSIHLRDVCSGMLSSPSDPRAKFNITACYPYSAAASGLVNLISKIPSSTTVLTTNISIPVITQAQEMSIYLTNLTNTLDQIIFAFYMITLISSGFVILGSIAQLLLPTSGTVMYANLMTSTLSAASALSASATTTAFITTANNIINLFGSAIGLRAELSAAFLALTWTSFAVALLTNWYLLAVWFVEFRTISVKVQRRSPQDLGNWRRYGVFRESKGGFVEETVQEMSEERPELQIGSNTMRRLSSRFRRRSSTIANF